VTVVAAVEDEAPRPLHCLEKEISGWL